MTEVLPHDDRVDTSRAGVVGRSYGGYMTLTLAARHPELWRGAVDMFGPYDLFTFMDRLPETWKPYFALAVGRPREGPRLPDRALAEDAHRRHLVPAARDPGTERSARRRARVARRRRAAARARTRRRLPRLRGRGPRRAEARRIAFAATTRSSGSSRSICPESLLGSRPCCGGSPSSSWLSRSSQRVAAEATTSRPHPTRRRSRRRPPTRRRRRRQPTTDGHRYRRVQLRVDEDCLEPRRGIRCDAQRRRIAGASGDEDDSRDIEEFSQYVDEVPGRDPGPTSRPSRRPSATYADELKDIGYRRPAQTPTAEQLQQLQACLAGSLDHVDEVHELRCAATLSDLGDRELQELGPRLSRRRRLGRSRRRNVRTPA